ncbi:cupin domain-containing protein [Anaerovibrio sp.]|uniref:cupin domain-containing protein n=1 Tax=Anaerovibrio sp. TaxID=1872532 RepID=UPI0025C07E1E|nr:cupin domain-containing protein [Anaerovibrio sp.]MBR2142981.1 alpha/beta fold hydrolase [Anaerovibrio sp.]
MKYDKILLLTLAMGLFASTAGAMSQPVTLADQGSFFAGGKVVKSSGIYKDDEPTNFDGETLHGDAAYVFWQKPVKAKTNAMVFLHGFGQSGKTWETTPDGRDGFQNIFLSKGYSVYIVDEPRRGRAGNSTVPMELKAQPQDQLWYDNFRIGQWPNYYDNVAVPRDEESRAQFFHQITPDTGKFDVQVVAESMTAVMEKAGDGVLVTHSAGGGPGWLTAAHSDKVRGVIALEPGTFPFLKEDMPEVESTTSPFPAPGMEVSREEFQRLLKIPMVVYFGDNIKTGSEPDSHWGLDNWRVRLNLAKKWEQTMKRHGGDVQVISLPDIGIKGNTHFLMADLNNIEVADAMEAWMKEKGLVQEVMPLPLGKDISERFVGTVHRNDLIDTDDIYKLPQTNVITFEPGSHSGWHTHGAMTVIGIAGLGIYQEWGKEPVLIKPGDVVQIPAGVSHFHGAIQSSRFQQIVIYDKNWQAPATSKAHIGPVTDEEYHSINFANPKTSDRVNSNGYLFNYSPEPFKSPNFNNPVYLGNVLPKPNEANSPEWTYVVFPRGTYNRWHRHKTGQVLIATDGIGYHQIKGGKLEILHPGDVAFCPPGVVHWHGAAPSSSFAHIAISPQDNHEVTWYDFPAKEYSLISK